MIEDAPNGIRAAHAAGMVCMAVTNSRSCEDLAEADLIVGSLQHVDPEQLARLFVAAS